MPRGRKRDEETPVARVEGLYEQILASLRPERDITAGEFMKRAFTFPQIDRIMVQKYAAGTWNFAEHVETMSAGFEPDQIEAYLRERYGPWRFRLMAIANGESICQMLLNLDGWQDSEAKAALSLPQKPSLGPNARPVSGAAMSDLMKAANERIEIENATRLLRGLDQQQVQQKTETDMAPMKMMADMMVSTMAMMKEALTLRPATGPQNDPLATYLMEEIRFLREQATKPEKERDVGALTRTIESIDTLLQKALNTNLADVISGAGKAEPASGWAGVVSGILEGVKPHLAEIVGFLQARQAQQLPRYARPAAVIPFPAPGAPPTQPLQDATPRTNGPTPPAEEAVMPSLNPAYVEVLTMLKDALRSKNWRVVDAVLMNPPLRGQINLDPEVPAKLYAAQLATVDPEFKALEPEIGEYLKHMAESMTDDEEPV